MSVSITERAVPANGLSHHVIEWSGSLSAQPTLVLGHGFLDLAWSWDPVARRLVERGFRCIAFDWRGHGESEWIGKGGYYHFVDYLLDLDDLLPQLVPDGPVSLVGHSMAGGACAMYAGTRPDRIARLAVLEGLGPPPTPYEQTPDRAASWLRGVAQTRAKPQRSMRTPADALARMRLTTPDLPEELGLFIAEKSTRPAPNGEGLVWSFDPLHKTTGPMPFRTEIFAAFCQRITAPTLLIFGENGFRLPDEAERAAHIRYHERVEIPKTGHMMHWLAPDAVATALADFFGT